MPAFIAFIVSAVTSAFDFLARIYGRKLVLGTAFILAYTAILIIAIAGLNYEMSQMIATLPTDSYVLAGLSLVPGNAITCIALIVGMRSVTMVYSLSVNLLKIKLLS